MPSKMELRCAGCEKDLLATSPIVGNVEWSFEKVGGGRHSGKIESVRWRHKACQMDRKGWEGWEDLDDLSIPHFWLNFWMTMMNGIRTGGNSYADEAYEDLKTVLLAMSQKTLRAHTDADKKRLAELGELPSWAGGLGRA